MKITIAYTEGEEMEAIEIANGVVKRAPLAKVRKSDRHPPFKHIYLTTKKPENYWKNK